MYQKLEGSPQNGGRRKRDSESSDGIVTRKSSFFDPSRADAPEEQNGIPRTSLQLMNSMIGAGILSFPVAVAKVGIVYIVLLTAFFCASFGLTAGMMVKVLVKEKRLDCSSLTEKVLGPRYRFALDLAVFVAMVGQLLSYLNVIGSLGCKAMTQTMEDLGVTPDSGLPTVLERPLTVVETYSGFMVVFVSLIVLPVVWYNRAYGELTWISGLSSTLITCSVILIALEGFRTEWSYLDEASLWPVSINTCIRYVGNVAFATSAQWAIPEAYASTKRELKHRLPIAGMIAAMGGGVLLLSMAFVGVWTFGQAVSPNVMLSLPHDWEGTVGPSLVVLHLLAYIPSSFVILRLNFFKLFGINVFQIPAWTYGTSTFVMIAIPLAMMASVPPGDVAGVFNLILGLTGDIPLSFACFIVPGLLYQRSIGAEGGKAWLLVARITVVAGVFCILCCPVAAVRDFVAACSSDAGCSSY